MLIYGFIVSAEIAALLNAVVAVFAFREGGWQIGVAYGVIALTLALLAFLAWYIATRQKPYRWRPDDRD